MCATVVMDSAFQLKIERHALMLMSVHCGQPIVVHTFVSMLKAHTNVNVILTLLMMSDSMALAASQWVTSP
jgi:hypothetical protein